MQTLTIECKNDTIAEHIYSLLSHLPKKDVVISRNNADMEIDTHKKLLKQSFNDLKNGNVIKTGKTAIL